MGKEVRFFLGGNSSQGFVSLFDQLDKGEEGWKKIIVKGGPGSGKSTLMKRCGEAMQAAGHRVEWIYCASDPDSLDAVVDWDGHITLVDGTAPHVIEASCPGAYETVVNLAEAWDENILQKNREKIMQLTAMAGRLHGRAAACLAGAGALEGHNRKTAEGVIDRETIRRKGRELAQGWPEGEASRETLRMLSAVSAGKTAFFDETLTALADVIYEIDDPWGAGAHALLEDLRIRARDHRLKVILCPSLFEGKTVWEHLFLPELGVAFTTANRYHRGTWKPWVVRSLPAAEWMDMDALQEEKNAVQTCSDQAAKLVEQAQDFAAQAKAVHDQLETEYAAAMDYDMLNALTERIVTTVLQ